MPSKQFKQQLNTFWSLIDENMYGITLKKKQVSMLSFPAWQLILPPDLHFHTRTWDKSTTKRCASFCVLAKIGIDEKSIESLLRERDGVVGTAEGFSFTRQGT